jgi:chromosome segregation ATPase
MVSLHSPVYGRTWLSVKPHPGDTVSCTQAEALIRAAEAKTGLRPWRRTDLLRERIDALEVECQQCQEKAQKSQEALEGSQTKRMATQEEIVEQETLVLELEAQYRERQRPERPYSALAKARQCLNMLERRQKRLKRRIPTLEKQLHHRQQRVIGYQSQIRRLQQRSKWVMSFTPDPSVPGSRRV